LGRHDLDFLSAIPLELRMMSGKALDIFGWKSDIPRISSWMSGMKHGDHIADHR
jgi:hypothetical protein